MSKYNAKLVAEARLIFSFFLERIPLCSYLRNEDSGDHLFDEYLQQIGEVVCVAL